MPLVVERKFHFEDQPFSGRVPIACRAYIGGVKMQDDTQQSPDKRLEIVDSPSGDKTTTDSIFKASQVDDTGVYFLGCFDKRVTVYSQQVRALNLVDAILSSGRVRPAGRVAIIGGGMAGVTAAAAFGIAAPNVTTVLYESRSALLHLQSKSQRFLHPHIYDWPAPEVVAWPASPAVESAPPAIASSPGLN